MCYRDDKGRGEKGEEDGDGDGDGGRTIEGMGKTVCFT